MVLWTLGLFLGLEALTGQVIEPVFEGHSTGLSPVAVVISATFWAWLWGPVGLVLATPLTVILVVLAATSLLSNFLMFSWETNPRIGGGNFYQRMLARDPIEAVEQAKSFMATHSLSDYCDEVARPALILAQRDVERGVLDDGKTRIIHETVDNLFIDIAHEHWVSKKEAHAATLTPATKLPLLEKDQLALNWRSKEPLVSIGVHSKLDESAAVVMATLVQIHGIASRMENPEALGAAKLAKLDLSGVALICLSSIDMMTPAHIHYAARRLKSRAPHAKVLLGVWSAIDDKALSDLKEAVNADYVARTFHEAAAIILGEATARNLIEAKIQPTLAAKSG